MEGRTSTKEVVKPVFLKAGIPLVLSVAGFVCARFIARRCTIARASPMGTKVNSPDEAICNSLDSTTSRINDDEDDMITSPCSSSLIESSDIEDKAHPEEVIVSLKSRIEELERRESGLGRRFLQYDLMKEQEFVLLEMRNMLLLETARVEFLDREISSMEAEKQRFEDIVLESFEVLKQLEFVNLENGLLRRKVTKLLRKTIRQSHLIRDCNSKIGAAEAEILSRREELDTRTDVIKKLEDDVSELQAVVNQLQEEKNELLMKLNSVENLATSISKIEAGVRMDDHDELVDELEQLRKDRAAEAAELTRLRWTNSSLRDELMRSQKQLEYQNDKKKNHLELEHVDDGSVSDQREVPLGSEVFDNVQSAPRRKNLLRKIKRWVEGEASCIPKKELDEKERDRAKRFRGAPVLEEAEEEHINPGRRSCSSA